MSEKEQESQVGLAPRGVARPTRRDLLTGAGAALGTLALPGLPAAGGPARAEHPGSKKDAAEKPTPFKFVSEPVRLRKSFYDLTDDELQLYCLAVGYMRNGTREKPLPLDHPLQWDQFALLHAEHCTEADLGHAPQVHWSWFFLPWHRAYLFFLERALAHFLTDVLKVDATAFALPYWDWETHKEIPNTRVREQARPPKPSPFFGFDRSIDTLSDPLQFRNHSLDNMALWSGYRGPSLEKPGMKSDNEGGPVWKQHTLLTAFYTDPVYINSILGFPFDVFAGGRVISRDDGQGMLEQFSHNLVHDWVGARYGPFRDMGTLRYAALDPLFYLHHANIDRIWSLYRYTPDPETLPDWGKQAFTFTDVTGKLVSVTVADTVTQMTNVKYAPPQAPSAGARMLLASAPRRPKKPPTETSAKVFAKATMLTAKPLTLSVANGGEDVRNLLSRAAEPDKPSLSLLEFDLGPIEYSGRFTVRIFANKPDATLHTSVTDPHFVGVLTALDSHKGRDAAEDKASHKFWVNVSREVSNFYNIVRPGEGFTLTLVPVGTEESLNNFRLPIRSVAVKVYEPQ